MDTGVFSICRGGNAPAGQSAVAEYLFFVGYFCGIPVSVTYMLLYRARFLLKFWTWKQKSPHPSSNNNSDGVRSAARAWQGSPKSPNRAHGYPGRHGTSSFPKSARVLCWNNTGHNEKPKPRFSLQRKISPGCNNSDCVFLTAGQHQVPVTYRWYRLFKTRISQGPDPANTLGSCWGRDVSGPGDGSGIMQTGSTCSSHDYGLNFWS